MCSASDQRHMWPDGSLRLVCGESTGKSASVVMLPGLYSHLQQYIARDLESIGCYLCE